VAAVQTNRIVDPDALAVWTDFLRFHATVTDRLGRELGEAVGMPLTWYDVLLQLANADGGHLRMQDLARAVVLSRSGLSRLVDRLEQVGYVERTVCDSDRRGILAEITTAGRAALREAAPIHLRGIAEHFASHLSADDLAALRHALATLLAGQTEPTGPCGCEE
jgi:DNA-binding MarR family transcriptional regulator